MRSTRATGTQTPGRIRSALRSYDPRHFAQAGLVKIQQVAGASFPILPRYGRPIVERRFCAVLPTRTPQHEKFARAVRSNARATGRHYRLYQSSRSRAGQPLNKPVVMGSRRKASTHRPLLRKDVLAGQNLQKRSLVLDCPSFPGNSGGPDRPHAGCHRTVLQDPRAHDCGPRSS
jgi:hypothetical protein